MILGLRLFTLSKTCKLQVGRILEWSESPVTPNSKEQLKNFCLQREEEWRYFGLYKEVCFIWATNLVTIYWEVLPPNLFGSDRPSKLRHHFIWWRAFKQSNTKTPKNPCKPAEFCTVYQFYTRSIPFWQCSTVSSCKRSWLWVVLITELLYSSLKPTTCPWFATWWKSCFFLKKHNRACL